MKIMRYTGANTREVLARIRAELGPDAVILSNREVVGGVELMAAVDFDARHIQAEAARAAQAEEAVRSAPAAEPARRPSAETPSSPSGSARPRPGYAGPSVRDVAPEPADVAASPVAPAPKASRPSEPQADVAGELESLRAELRDFRGWVQERMLQVLPGQAPASATVAQLEALGFERGFCAPFADGAQDLDRALSKILERLPTGRDLSTGASGVFALLGATGVGKTTTVAKLAARLVLAHGTQAVGLVTTDTYRIGGVEQLKIYGRILGVPVVVARNAEELSEHLRAFALRRFVLVDTIGLSPRDQRLEEQLQWLSSLGTQVQRLLLLTGGMGRGFYDALWRLYGDHEVAGCVLTKLDETSMFGAAIQWLIEQQLPLWYYTDGQRVPEDLHAPSVDKMKALLLASRPQEQGGRGAGPASVQQPKRQSA